jgi:hypothetical protein
MAATKNAIGRSPINGIGNTEIIEALLLAEGNDKAAREWQGGTRFGGHDGVRVLSTAFRTVVADDSLSASALYYQFGSQALSSRWTQRSRLVKGDWLVALLALLIMAQKMTWRIA